MYYQGQLLVKFAWTFEPHIIMVTFARSVATAYTPTVFELLVHTLGPCLSHHKLYEYALAQVWA